MLDRSQHGMATLEDLRTQLQGLPFDDIAVAAGLAAPSPDSALEADAVRAAVDEAGYHFVS